MAFWNKPVVIERDQPADSAVIDSAIRISGPTVYPLNCEKGSIKLPDFVLAPSEVGRVVKLASLKIVCRSADKRLEELIGQAYKQKYQVPNNELKKATNLMGGTIVWPEGSPIGESAELIFSIAYYPQEETGGFDSKLETRTARITLYPGETVRPLRRVVVRPKHMLKIYESGGGPALIIRTSALVQSENAPDKPIPFRFPPKISLVPNQLEEIAGAWQCLQLQGAVGKMLGSLDAPKVNMVDGTYVWEQVLKIELSEDDREKILDRMARDPNDKLRIPISIEVENAVPRRLELEINPKTRIRDGMIAIDLGNSSTAIIVQDPTIIDGAEVPQEHFLALRSSLLRFLVSPDASIGVEHQSYWQALLKDVCRSVGLDDSNEPSRILSRFIDDPDSLKLYRTLAGLESQLFHLKTNENDLNGERIRVFRSRVGNILCEIYRSVFLRVPLKQWNIQIVRRAGEDTDYTESELELLRLEPLPLGIVGSAARVRRISQMTGEPVPLHKDGELVGGRFIESPKRFLSKIEVDRDLTVKKQLEQPMEKLTRATTASNRDYVVDPTQLETLSLDACEILQATWNGLLHPSGDPDGLMANIDQVVLTYPADLRPEARLRIHQAISELGVTGVCLDFDESISPAIFHLEQLFGSFEEIGCEAFKVGCVKRGNLWSHDMLVIDIGAGTTDVSLVRLEMREQLPDKSDFGGKLYEVTPRLLGAAGRDQAGGHQLTLNVFRVLKQILSQWCIQASRENTGSSTAISYSCREDEDSLRAALDEAEKLIPTRFATRAPISNTEIIADGNEINKTALKRFSALWRWSEQLKIEISQLLATTPKPEPKDLPIDAEKRIDIGSHLREILEGTEFESTLQSLLKGDAVIPWISINGFTQLASICIDPSIQLASSLASAAVASINRTQQPNTSDAKISDSLVAVRAKQQIVQSIVLSGRACSLPMVQQKIKEIFRNLAPSARLPKIFFRDDYAKTATAIGACRARRRIASAFRRAHAPEQLNGKCELDFKIQNLFFYLPCTYTLGDANDGTADIVFSRHDEFTADGRSGNGIIRSYPAGKGGQVGGAEAFGAAQREIRLYRNDGDGYRGREVGLLKVEEDVIELAKLPGRDLNAESDFWRVRFEIDHMHRLSALFIRPEDSFDKPIYEVGFVVPKISAEPEIAIAADPKVMACLKDLTGLPPIDCHWGLHEAGREPFSKSSDWIPINVFESKDSGAAVPYKAWMTPIFHKQLSREGKLHFSLTAQNGTQSTTLQYLTFAPTPIDGARTLGFRTAYRLMLVSDKRTSSDVSGESGGRLVLVVGNEPKYWETTEITEWLDSTPGRVLRQKLDAPSQRKEWWNDPFCGLH